MSSQQHSENWNWKQEEVEEGGEEGERDNWVDRQPPQGELGGGGHQPPEVEQEKQGHQRQEVGCIQGEGLADHHHPLEEEEGVGSPQRVMRAVGAGLQLDQ